MPNSAANIIVIVAFINVHTLRLGQNSVIKKTTDSSACTHDDIASLYQQLETPLNFIAYESGQLLCDFVSFPQSF